MSFELKIQTDLDGKETELIEETITHTHQTRKLWDYSQLEEKIANLEAQIQKLQERKTLLESQLSKFTVKEIRQ